MVRQQYEVITKKPCSGPSLPFSTPSTPSSTSTSTSTSTLILTIDRPAAAQISARKGRSNLVRTFRGRTLGRRTERWTYDGSHTTYVLYPPSIHPKRNLCLFPYTFFLQYNLNLNN